MKAWLKAIWTKLKPTVLPALVALVTALGTLMFPDWFPKPAPVVPDPTPAERPITGPAVVAPGRVAILSSANAAFTAQTWRLVNSDQPIETLAADKVAFATDVKGIYWFAVSGIRKRDKTPAIFVHRLIVDSNNPDPGPGPGPTPTPDGFQAKLQAAYSGEPDPAKAEQRAAFAAFYRAAAESTKSPQIATWGQLFEVLAGAATETGVYGKLPATQVVVQSRLETSLPGKAAATKPIDAAGRDLARQVFLGVATAFEALR